MRNLLIVFSLAVLFACTNSKTSSPRETGAISTTTSIQHLLSTPTIRTEPTIELTRSITPETSATATRSSPTATLTLTPILIDDLPTMAQVVISEAEIQNETNIQNFGDSYVDYSFGSTLRSSDATSELQDYCPLDCVKRVFYGRQAAMTLIMMRTGDPDKAKSTVWTLYNDFAQGTYLGEYIEEREWVNAPKENIWILALTSDDYALGASYGSITILLRLHVPSTDNAYPQVQMISIFANLQLDKLRDAGFPP